MQFKKKKKKSGILVVFGDMITDMFNNKNLQQIVIDLYIYFVSINHSCFDVPKLLEQIMLAILSWKIQTNRSFNKSHLIDHQILT